LKKTKKINMLNELKYPDKLELDQSKLEKCCPPAKPAPPSPPDSDCCYNTWQGDLNQINSDLTAVTKELTFVQRHLTVANERLTRLKTWNDELVTANELALSICRQLEVIESRLSNICKNTDFTTEGIRVLICMIREFYIVVDELQIRYDRLVNCIKCLNNPALSMTQGIGQCLGNYGTALTAVVATRDGLVQLVMEAYSASVGLHEEICDDHGYKRLIAIWQGTLGCRIPCDEGPWGPAEPRQASIPPNMPDPYWLDPILRFPLCNETYVHDINRWYKEEKELVKALNLDVTRLSKRQMHLQSVQQSLVNALKEVSPSVRCS
jgi:hypothetical protein